MGPSRLTLSLGRRLLLKHTSEVLYEDDGFANHELAALVVAKVHACWATLDG